MQRLLGLLLREGKKNWPIDDRRVPSNDPRNNCGTHFSSSPFLVSKVANSFTLSLAHCIVCSITAGNDFSVQWGTSSSGGSRLKRDTHKMITNNNKKLNNSFYYINTNEIPGELSRENLISSHAKKHVRKYHRCYGYIINRAFHTKKLLK